jgi:hypothetical protein
LSSSANCVERSGIIDELEGSGAHRVLGKVSQPFLFDVLAIHREHGVQAHQAGRVGFLGDDAEREGIDYLHLLDPLNIGALWGFHLRRQHAIHDEPAKVLGGERVAGVVLDAAAQLELQGDIIDHFP